MCIRDSREGGETDQATIIEKMSEFFAGGLISGKSMSDSLSVNFSPLDAEGNPTNSYETASFRLLDYLIDQQGVNIQKGERRVIFTVGVDIPRNVEVKGRRLTLELDVDVGENVDVD